MEPQRTRVKGSCTGSTPTARLRPHGRATTRKVHALSRNGLARSFFGSHTEASLIVRRPTCKMRETVGTVPQFRRSVRNDRACSSRFCGTPRWDTLRFFLMRDFVKHSRIAPSSDCEPMFSRACSLSSFPWPRAERAPRAVSKTRFWL